MANYYASFRSNYFKVKDIEKFKVWLSGFYGLELFESGEIDYAFGFGSMDAGLPSGRHDEELDDFVEIDFIDELSKHLAEGEVAIVQECGSEKLRYLIGYSVVVDWQGKQKTFNIDAAYSWATKKYGKPVSRCEY